jgi:hypothetical protein
MKGIISGEHDWVLFIGNSQELSIEGTVNYRVTPGEPMICRTPNGNGYPGSPPECEFCDIVITSMVVTCGKHDHKLLWPMLLQLDAFSEVEESLRDHIFEEHCEPQEREYDG